MADKYMDKFNSLADQDTDSHVEFFLKSFIFDLGDNWKEVVELSKKFKHYLKDQSEKKDLNHVQASNFLQQNGKTRTGLERKRELQDIDLNSDGRICFIEYLLLHYKVMILKAYYKRHEKEPTENLSNDGVGVTGVGLKLLEELFTLPLGLDPKLIAAIEEFTAKKRAREKKMGKLEKKAAKGGVLGKAARNEIEQMMSQDLTAQNRVELTLNALKKKSKKKSGAVALEAKRKAEEEEKKAKLAAGRNKMAAMAAMFGGAKKTLLNKTEVKVGKTTGLSQKTKLHGKIKNKNVRGKLKHVESPKTEGVPRWAKNSIKKKAEGKE